MVLLIVLFSKNKCIIDYQLNSVINNDVVNSMTYSSQKYSNTPKL